MNHFIGESRLGEQYKGQGEYWELPIQLVKEWEKGGRVVDPPDGPEEGSLYRFNGFREQYYSLKGCDNIQVITPENLNTLTVHDTSKVFEQFSL